MRELRQFVEVANQRSISRAAKKLNISQPALSRAIRQLEDSYGVPLFNRTGAGVELSVYGSVLYSRAVRILPALDEAKEEIEHLQGRAKAVIRIATGDLWGLVILPGIIKAFSRTHPGVVVHVEIADDGTRFEGMRHGVYDLVFGTLSYKYEAVMQVEFETLARQATYIYCDKDHHLAKATTVTLDDLLRQRWISPGYGDDEGPGQLERQTRDFAVRVDSMLQALLIMQGSPLVMAASSGFEKLFDGLGIRPVMFQDHGRIQESGAIYFPRALEKSPVRDFLRLVRGSMPLLALPEFSLAETA
ncbi:LysR family transcriptional regulator [Rhizobium leguminosarum]|uniref:LysR family transcriptional regulator n=1 Tax=Rhizobium leguminosarum TaxID=384 RepID=UPI003F995CA2